MSPKDFALSLFFGRAFQFCHEFLDCMPNYLGAALPRYRIPGRELINTFERWFVNSYRNSFHVVHPINGKNSLSMTLDRKVVGGDAGALSLPNDLCDDALEVMRFGHAEKHGMVA